MKAIKVIYANGTAKYTLDKTEETLEEMHKNEHELKRRMIASLNGRD